MEAQRGRPETLVLFESPRRVAATLAEIADVLGERKACLARELTKKHEEVLRDRASDLAERCRLTPPRGECTLVIEGALEGETTEGREWTDLDIDDLVRAQLEAGTSVRVPSPLRSSLLMVISSRHRRAQEKMQFVRILQRLFGLTP